MKPDKSVPETDTLTLQRRMYERRMKRLKQRGGLTEREVADEANAPSPFRKGRTGQDVEPERAAAAEG